MGMTPEEALLAAASGGARALQRDDVGQLAPGSRADAVIPDCPSYTHPCTDRVYPLVAATLIRGRVEFGDPGVGADTRISC